MADIARKPGIANKIEIIKVFSAEAIALSASATSDNICTHGRTGIFSLQFAVSGNGTAKFEYEISLDGTNWLEPSTASDIAAAQTAASGPGADGKDIYAFEPILAPYIRIKCTETAGANSITVTAWLAMQ